MAELILQNPNAPASRKQVNYIRQLTGENVSGLTVAQASKRIEELELEAIANQAMDQIIDDVPFSEAHVSIVQGSQRGGKTVYAVGKVVDAYRKDCVAIYCKDVLHIEYEVKAYYKAERIAKIKQNGMIKYIEIPKSYELCSPMKIFSNIHLYGLPYVYIPSFKHLAVWLKSGFVSNGWLIMDEAHVGINARSGSTTLGKELVTQCMQLGKSKLDVMLITHMPRLIDWVARTIPTKAITCTYNEKNHRVTYTLRRKGESNTEEHSFDASQYWPNYRTNEKVNQ
ncbi:MAG: hypothetical protein WC389_19980 [Lutibacter sp.]|jgi:hypothetical protein